MKIEYDWDYEKEEKEILYDILCTYFLENMKNDFDALGCEPACRDEQSPGCDFCIKREIKISLEKGDFWAPFIFGNKEYIFYNKKNKRYNYDEIKLKEGDCYE